MTRISFASTLALLTALVSVAPASLSADAVQTRSSLRESLGGVQWGWSPKQVFSHHAKNVRAFYNKKIATAEDAMHEDAFRAMMEQEVARIRDSYVEFDGTTSGYDSGFLKSEFTHHNKEALLRLRGDKSDDYYLFINNKLWKRYRAFQASVFEGASFDEFGSALQGRYGKAQRKNGTFKWSTKKISARAIDNTEFYGFYSLVLEDPRTAAKIGKLRTHKVRDTGNKKSVVDLVKADGDDDLNSDIADRITGKIHRRPSAE